ncbi:MAG: PP2C family protein-serine/threonine phosphatase, partial [Crocinitomicaceae bacterium]
KNFSQSIDYNKKALVLAQELRHPQIIREASNTLFKIYKNTGRYKESLDMHELFIATRDSIISDENRQETIRQEFSYQYEKRADSLAIEQRKKDELTKAEQQQEEGICRRGNEKKNLVIGFVLGGLILVMIFTFYTIKRLRVTRKQKVIIEEQKNEVEKSQRETHEQKQILEEAHNEITGSIQYAKRLQDALLPSYNQLTDMLPDSFIFFKPKDVVSGDFYWCEQFNDSIYFAVADCTGHGVPGALVSVVCSNALNRSVREFGIQEPSKILDKTRQLVIEAFAKSGDAVKDGMDISLCSFKVVSEDQSVDKVIFSGANNPLWIIRKNEYLTESELTARSTLQRDSVSLIEFKGDKQPIGLDDRMSNFSQQEVELFPGDAIYLFSDGFADQFGGENGKKLKYKPFKLLLLQMHAHTGAQQSKKLADFFHEWKGDLEQVDDVCVVGVKVNP